LDEAYLSTIEPLQSTPEENQTEGEKLNIVYTSLHGAGITMVPAALAMWGFFNTHIVESQQEPDGSFPTVPAPNPEIHEALKLGIDKLLQEEGDILLATDADTDRVGCVVNHKGDITILDGNEIACLCLDHVLGALKEGDKKPACIKSIVTTELFKAICDSYGIACFDVLTGFKYIGQMITSWDSSPDGYRYIFGGEESYGYLLSDYARDKDAIIACCLLAEAALQAKLQGKTLVDKLDDIYAKYGVYRTRLLSVNYPETKEGREKMESAMQTLRDNAPEKILGTQVLRLDDFLKGTSVDLITHEKTKLTLPKSDVLIFRLQDGTKICVRPSGTEPRIKLYCEARALHPSSTALGIEQCDVLTRDYLKTVESILLP
ncbi:MAG: phospho-sugar mutase, partial [Chlamydiia bacterium]|nr:phospho-sugar mutase [Chlamydiia bacterium]